MEYSKEDLMEAKKQILGEGENMGTEESKKIWEENAQFWDNAMGDESNEFHREVVRPKVTELLSPNPADYILDIACGNGNYSSYREPNKGSEWGAVRALWPIWKYFSVTDRIRRVAGRVP